jgi:hypothetical protein
MRSLPFLLEIYHEPDNPVHIVILSRVIVTIDGYLIDSCVYWITVYTLQFATVHTLYNSQQLSPFSSSEDCGSSSATTAATNSYGVPCHH